MIANSGTSSAWTGTAMANAPSGGATAADLWAYASRTLTGPTINFNSPQANVMFAGGTITQGATYANAAGTGLTCTKAASATGWPSDLTSHTVTLQFKPATLALETYPNASSLSVTGTVSTPTGTSQACRFDATAAQTATLSPSSYNYQVWATSTNVAYLLESGTVNVKDDIRS
jgi:hypothetical protein